jgi:stearoyl-CoA desaturase (delta-9 desaturase)
VVRFQKRYLLLGYLIFGLILPGLLGLLTDGSFVIGALWIGFIGRFISWHCIWTINSLAHWRGVKEFSRVSSAVYAFGINLLQNGEGCHNFHHNFERDFRHGHRWYEWSDE